VSLWVFALKAHIVADFLRIVQNRLLPVPLFYARRLCFYAAELAALAQFDATLLPADLGIDHKLLSNRLESMRWYLTEFKEWQWNPASYNAAGPIGLILNTPYAPEEDRLRTVMARLEQVPAFYQAARANISEPTAQHTELAVTQGSLGTLIPLGTNLQKRVSASNLERQTEAENKWRRVKLSQVQLTSYFTGYAEIYDFREQMKLQMGSAFDLKTFHNRFLSFWQCTDPCHYRPDGRKRIQITLKKRQQIGCCRFYITAWKANQISKRSSSITLVHALTKSCTNSASPSFVA